MTVGEISFLFFPRIRAHSNDCSGGFVGISVAGPLLRLLPSSVASAAMSRRVKYPKSSVVMRDMLAERACFGSIYQVDYLRWEGDSRPFERPSLFDPSTRALLLSWSLHSFGIVHCT